MYSTLQMISHRLLDEVDTTYHRYIYQGFKLSNRLVGLVGPRGVGKTTLMLQYIKEHYSREEVFYFSADHIQFKTTTLYEFIEELYLKYSITVFFIDEIHKYENWNQELKNLYDGFPSLQIVFSGSSSLDLVKGSYDLSRRAKMYHLSGLSFREYLQFYHQIKVAPLDFYTLMEQYLLFSKEVANIPGILGHFQQYLRDGYYPYFIEDPTSYYEKILLTIEKTISEDIANFYNLKTGNLRYLSKILNYLTSVPPGKVSTYNLGKNLNISDKTAASYLTMLSETGLIEIIYPVEGGNQGLRKPEKVFFNNTNLYYALNQHTNTPPDIGSVRELAFIQATRGANLAVFHHKNGDYQIDDFVFEIGGKNKARKQIKNIEHAYLVKDDILIASKGEIPLYYFGFLF